MRTNFLLAALALISLPFVQACRSTTTSIAPAPVDTTAEEYAIYKRVIEDVCQPVESMPVLDVTVANHLHDAASEEPYKFVRDNTKTTRKETLDDFWMKNQEPMTLDYKLDLVRGNVYVTEAQAPRVPTYPGFAELSRIGFNPEHTQAIVYCGHVWTLSSFQGRAYYVVLDKTDVGWTITSKLTTKLTAPPTPAK
ncbi:MAG: hypothetical protein K8S98_06385 [Planctomycetes bacterium]|nr:hypothetical protein [Planctomycetota bacterium]